MAKKQINGTLLITLLGLLAALGPLSIAMYIPGFAHMATEFGVAPQRVALTLTTYFIGITIGQLALGPLIDRYGRRTPLLWAQALYVIASLGCAWSATLDQLALVRFFQALGGSAGMVSAMAIISDVYKPDRRAGAFSLVMLVLGVAPIVSPSLGSYFVASFNWEANFLFLAAFGAAITLALLLYLPETGEAHPNAGLRHAGTNYLTVLRTRPFLAYAIGGSLSNSVIFAFVASSPLVFMGYYKVDAGAFALLYGISASGVLLGNYMNSRLVRKAHYLKVMDRGLLLLVVLTVAMAALTWVQPDLPSSWVVASLFVVLFAIGLVYPNAVSASLAPFKALSGSASALMGACMMGVSALTTALVGVLVTRSSFTMFAVMAVMSVLAALILQGARRSKTTPSNERA